MISKELLRHSQIKMTIRMEIYPYEGNKFIFLYCRIYSSLFLLFCIYPFMGATYNNITAGMSQKTQ